jgi:phosphatidylinositol 4-kinase type 2
VLVWDDELEITDEQLQGKGHEVPEDDAVSLSSPRASINTMPLPSPSTSMRIPRPRMGGGSISDFPPRRSSDFAELPRPISFSTKYPRVHPATTGVAILEHMERLDAVEANLKRLAVDESIHEEDEMDVAELSTPRVRASTSSQEVPVEDVSNALGPLSPSAASECLPSVVEVPSSSASVMEEDLVAMSKSMPHMDMSSALHTRWASHEESNRGLEWIVDGETPKVRTVIVEASSILYCVSLTGLMI